MLSHWDQRKRDLKSRFRRSSVPIVVEQPLLLAKYSLASDLCCDQYLKKIRPAWLCCPFGLSPQISCGLVPACHFGSSVP